MRGLKGKTVVRGVESFENAAGAGTYILVNNAGWDTPMPFLETNEEFWKKVVAINYLGPLQVTHAGGKRYGGAQRRQDHQHRLGRRARGLNRRSGLFRLQRRADRLREGARTRARAQQRADQHDLPG